MANDELIAGIRTRLKAAADQGRAAGSQAYMKSDMPTLGVRVPEVRKIANAAAGQWPCGSFEELRDTVLELWRSAAFREERYAAIDLTGAKPARGRLEMLPVYEEIIRTGAWWDLVDGVAHRICDLLQAHRPELGRVLRSWSSDPDMWVRRAAITAQLGAKSATDPGLLASVIEPNLADREFFIRKAIGWALREYAKTDADWVRQFVARHDTVLSPLSRREALRNLPVR
ncbi:3-methyladenine DNA glycosylase AlkD [Arthrobacter sp. PvP023]|uniref:DNA alkylation repair protein n=1 Tax=Micrococcaceae TaxID=1268 RepID=UPI001AE95CDD|nr:DNA alkylation repair protein [Arthrobacter sp. PvP023]MBP1135905.1 3-methyladenine DNA glycosylase AlkD [Arthrobacter sp. PvP023]